MARLFEKLHVLVKSSLNTVLSDPVPVVHRLSGRGAPDERDVAGLRQRIEAALSDEERMTADIQAMQQQIAEWDAQADRTLQAGDEVSARQIVRQMQTRQQQIALMEADLDAHRRSTFALIQQVNTLEAVVAEARQQQAQEPPREQAQPAAPKVVKSTPVKKAASRTNAPVEADDDDGESLAERLRQAQGQPAPSVQVDERAVEDDLARRRARLSL